MFNPLTEPLWFVHKRKRTPFFAYIFLGSSAMLKNDIDFDYRVNVGIFLDKIMFSELQRAKIEKAIAQKLHGDPDFLLRLMQKGKAHHAEALKLWQKLASTETEKKTNLQLAAMLEQYVESILPFGAYVALPFLAEAHMTREIRQGIEKEFSTNVEETFNLVTDPVEPGSIIEEKLSLLQIASKYKKGSDVSQKAAEHCKQFSWMKNVGYFEDYYDENYYLSRVKEAAAGDPEKEVEKTLAEIQEKKARFEALLAEIKDEKLATMINTTNQAVFFRSYRTEIFYSSARYVSHLFKEIAKRLNLPSNVDLLFLFPDEILEILKNNPPIPTDLIEQRKIAYIYFGQDDKSYFTVAGQAAIELDKKIPMHSTQEKTDDIKGQAAFIGKVKGIARVVHNLQELDKVKQGDVLVTHTTNVNFLPVLKLVVGIVTEEGGILSHASVISRELKIPAVIGTKIATHVIKDGDEIEVDAEKGLVHILKRALS
ncbi:MAG: PEP-utilizing enzyme [Candidatus Micrarchaeota archaeon]|nr:PEP-utilizing enzyme [Candidatus Micrarchaeota archaeon]